MPPGRNRRQRRRRAAAVGGLAYQAGKRRAEPQAPPEAQAPPPQAPAPEPAAPSPPSGSGALSPEAMQQLEQLAQLHEEGALTDEEFQQQKAKLLAG